MKTIDEAFLAAVENIARHGDTDVLPFPTENHVFFDKPHEIVDLLKDIHKDVHKALGEYPPVAEGMFSSAGYTGFRWVTRLDPLWNAYFLGLVIYLAEYIEDARLPSAKDTVFSYRYKWNGQEKTLFDKGIGWLQFQEASITQARNSRFVLTCDIADFYPSIYHHRLENALHKAVPAAEIDVCHKINKLLMQFSDNVSYGLPVGGPASRILSELLLNRVDRLLTTKGINFCRFADDYHIFADSDEDAYKCLLFLSEKLQANEGLLLQKAKTRIMSAEEFLITSEFAAENQSENIEETATRSFLKLRLHYDPYSISATADYEHLKGEIAKFDIVGMLGREMKKSRLHQSLTRKLIGALKHLEHGQRDRALLSLSENLNVLYPVFPSVMVLLKDCISLVAGPVREEIFCRLRTLILTDSYIVQVPTNLAFAVRVLAHDPSDETDEVLAEIYNGTQSSAIRRDVILAMAKRNADFWISDVRKQFKTVTEWERTALLMASYILGDEGEHWRKSIKGSLSPLQKVVAAWHLDRAKAGNLEVAL